MCKLLQYRAYPKGMLSRACNIVDGISRNHLLSPRKSMDIFERKSSPITFTTGFIVQYWQVVSIVKKHLPLLYSDENVRSILGDGVRFVSKRAPTLGNLVSPTYFSSHDKTGSTWLHALGSYKCGHYICVTCNHMLVTKTFESS